MDAVSYANSAKQAQRIKKFINDPDSTSGIVTVPKVIASGETITIPTGRVAVLPNVQIDGILNVENGGEVFIPSGATFGRVVEKVTSTDNAIVRFDGVTGAVQNSSVTITDNGNVGIGNTLDNNTRRIGFATVGGGSSAIESVTIGATNQDLVFKTTYGIESEKMRITGQGNVLVTGGGVIGYGTGSGGTVTQATSKSTSVTLNKPTGQITMNNAALAAGASVIFYVHNSLVQNTDIVYVKGTYTGSVNPSNYKIDVTIIQTGDFAVEVTNKSTSSLAEAVILNFIVLKGANS